MQLTNLTVGITERGNCGLHLVLTRTRVNRNFDMEILPSRYCGAKQAGQRVEERGRDSQLDA
jgi:hypothetical protein